MPSGAETVIVPLAFSLGAGSFDPGASLPRGGKPASKTIVLPSLVGKVTTVAGLSVMLIVSVAVEVSVSPSVSV